MADLSRTPQPGDPQPEPAQPQQAQPESVGSALSAVTGAVDGTKPRPEPLDPPMVPFALVGMATFALAGLGCLVFRDWLAEHGHQNWQWICLAGFLIGIPGLLTMQRHDRHRSARRALTHPQVREAAQPEPPAPAAD